MSITFDEGKTAVSMTTRRTRWLGGLAAGVLLASALAGCAEEGSGAQAKGDGIDFGATKDEYAKAFEDIKPITITAQSPSPKGSLTGAKFEGYMQAVEEWSDGKITFDIAYSNAIAPPTEVDDALRDGRLDMGSVVATYEPQEYPANSLLADVTFAGSQGAFVGLLESNTWWLDVAYQTNEIFDELADNGVKVVMPAFNSGLIALNCAEAITSLDDFDGAQIINGTAAQGKVLKSLGATPISMAYPEIYESLQRGVADCSMNSLLVSQLGGFGGEVPHATIDSSAGFGSGPGSLAFSQAAWDSYPLVVQQLLFDRLDAFMVSNYESVWQVISEVTTAYTEAGGGVSEYEDDAREAIAKLNADRLEELRGTDAVDDGDAFIDAVESSIEKWDSTITGELGYEEVAYDDFADFYASGDVDLQPLIDVVFEEILLPHRPA
ncbi:TRAP transporter substrate-binding protein DctP [Nocardioides alcanivorans]|uniref:TRAP transporter substrate-binding protein DctP n=1 Tax=Nocardioides alcanivorans TaxID=2897352 RepID=UPI001F1600D7|nr:TRAP transporter substrate-binding protein DctP [Nocardioides alcanivorans]